MAEEMVSVISTGEMEVKSEISDSISFTHPANKRPRNGSKGASSQFKGVMRQKSGQWGAQLYARYNRIWLGTFKSEIDAAMAYDSAAIMFRTGDTHRNLPWNDITVMEPVFQSYYSPEAVLSMIRGGSYRYKFMEFVKARNAKAKIDLNSVETHNNEGLTWKPLFQKKLTPSDAGKLNRLVIPKKYAIAYFPQISGTEKEKVRGVGGSGSKVNDVDLFFYDKFLKLWKFRYCYWSSSQSFVLTRGWNQFIKEKELKASDVISFYHCECRKGNEGRSFGVIDVIKSGNNGASVGATDPRVGRKVDLQLGLGHCYAFDGENHVKQEQESMASGPEQGVKTQGFKLFGVQIN